MSCFVPNHNPSFSLSQQTRVWVAAAHYSDAYPRVLAVSVTDIREVEARPLNRTIKEIRKNSLKLLRSRKHPQIAEEKPEWAKIVSDIQELESAVPVLRTNRKAGKLSKENVVGVLMDLKRLKEWQFVAEVIVWLKKQDWWTFSIMDHNLLIVAYAKLGQPEQVERAMSHLQKDGYRPNVATYTCLIEAYGRKSHFDKAELVLKKMLEEGPQPTALTYQALIAGLVKGGKYEDAERWFKSLEAGDTVKPDSKLFNLMVHAYGKSGRLEEASRLPRRMKFLEVPPTVVTYNSLLASQPCVKDVDGVLHQMQKANIEPDVVSYGARLNAFSKAGRGEEALYFFNTMLASGIKPNLTVYNILLDALANSNMLEEAEATVKQIRRDGFKPDVRSFTTLMNGYVKAGNMEKAIKVVERMKLAGVAANVVTYGTLMKGYAESGNLREMEKTYKSMAKKGVKPSQTIYTIMVQAYGKHENLDKAILCYKEMIAAGFVPDGRARAALSMLSIPAERKEEIEALMTVEHAAWKNVQSLIT